METVPIYKGEIPYRFEIMLGAEMFEMEIRYNQAHDFFTVDLYKDGQVLVYGKKMTYGVPLFDDVADERFPILQLVPRDEAGLESAVTWDNLGKTVFLAVVNP